MHIEHVTSRSLHFTFTNPGSEPKGALWGQSWADEQQTNLFEVPLRKGDPHYASNICTNGCHPTISRAFSFQKPPKQPIMLTLHLCALREWENSFLVCVHCYYTVHFQLTQFFQRVLQICHQECMINRIHETNFSHQKYWHSYLIITHKVILCHGFCLDYALRICTMQTCAPVINHHTNRFAFGIDIKTMVWQVKQPDCCQRKCSTSSVTFVTLAFSLHAPSLKIQYRALFWHWLPLTLWHYQMTKGCSYLNLP